MAKWWKCFMNKSSKFVLFSKCLPNIGYEILMVLHLLVVTIWVDYETVNVIILVQVDKCWK